MRKKEQLLREFRLHGTEQFACAMYHIEAEQPRMITGHHWHEEVELVYFSSGTFVLDINMEKYEISRPCFCFINSGELHCIQALSAGTEDAIVFDPQIISTDTYDMVQKKIIQPMIRGEFIFPRFIEEGDPCYERIKREFMEMEQVFLKEYEGQRYEDQKLVFDPVSQMLVKGGVMKIVSDLAGQRTDAHSDGEDSQKAEVLKKAITYIKEHYQEKIFIRDLAGAVSMNEQYFCRFFRQGIGKSPMEYVNEYRIKQARTLLEESELPVTEISLECGFHNQGNFLREFRKYTETTPLQYRKRIQDR